MLYANRFTVRFSVFRNLRGRSNKQNELIIWCTTVRGWCKVCRFSTHSPLFIYLFIYYLLFIIYYFFRVCKSVHHHTFNWIKQPDAANFQFYYLLFKYSSTCFGHPHAHHQELQQLQQQPLVYRQSLVIAVLLVVVGPVVWPRPTALLHEDARNMLSCI